MTAFATAEAASALGVVSCELRTVNHRYLEIAPRLPEEWRSFEALARELISARLSRGKVDLTLRARSGAELAAIELDEARVAQLESVHRQLGQRFSGLRVEFTELVRFPGVLRQADVDADAQQAALRAVLEQALDELGATREREGAKLAALLIERLDAIERILGVLRTLMPTIRAGLRTRLEARLAELKPPVDPGRLEQELVLQVTRSDVDEEIDRLATHVSEFRRVLDAAEPVGRRLDFLMQEFNREANTLGSKAVDVRSTQAAVELKVLIEQMREQVQNIE